MLGYKWKKCKNQNIFLGCNIEVPDWTVTDKARGLGGCLLVDAVLHCRMQTVHMSEQVL